MSGMFETRTRVLARLAGLVALSLGLWLGLSVLLLWAVGS